MQVKLNEWVAHNGYRWRLVERGGVYLQREEPTNPVPGLNFGPRVLQIGLGTLLANEWIRLNGLDVTKVAD